jgi:four helix bundle protein
MVKLDVNMSTGLENLEIYKLAKELETKVYLLTNDFPIDEKFGKTSQIKRSSASVADNIAESYGRYNYQEKIQFLLLARGSGEEIRSQLDRSKIICHNDEKINLLVEEYTIEIKKINGFIRFLRNKKVNNSITQRFNNSTNL